MQYVWNMCVQNVCVLNSCGIYVSGICLCKKFVCNLCVEFVLCGIYVSIIWNICGKYVWNMSEWNVCGICVWNVCVEYVCGRCV